MNWSDYEAVWKRQELPTGADADLATLKQTFEIKRRKMKGALFARDMLTATLSLFGWIGFAFMWWQVGKAGWPIALAIVLILGVTAVFVRERVRSHRNLLRPDASLLAKVEADIAELRHQRRLLLTIRPWCYPPLIVAVVIAAATLSRRSGHTGTPPGFIFDLLRNPLTLAWIIILTSASGFFISLAWRANRDELRKQIDPRLAELEKLRRDILSGL
jgi:hypothetical protein